MALLLAALAAGAAYVMQPIGGWPGVAPVDGADPTGLEAYVRMLTETLADLLGYPAAGLLVAALGSLIGAAFVVDSATYVVSALSGVGLGLRDAPDAADKSSPSGWVGVRRRGLPL